MSPQTGPQAVEHVRIDADQTGQRIDNFLMARIKGVPRSHIYRILRRGEVRVNRGRIRPSYRLQAGDRVRIPPLRTAATREPPRIGDRRLQALEAAILFEDEGLLVLDKPAGLAVHGGSGIRFGIIESLRQLRPGIPLELVHRLDRDTSGCLMIAKRRSLLREIHGLIRAHRVRKGYRALLAGALPGKRVRIDAPLRKSTLRSGERLVRVDFAAGKPAKTLFHRRERLGALSLAEVTLITGRTHQIRVHAAHRGTPVAGDEKYGRTAINRALGALGLRRLFLHAATLELRLPGSDPLVIEAPLPRELDGFLRRIREDPVLELPHIPR